LLLTGLCFSFSLRSLLDSVSLRIVFFSRYTTLLLLARDSESLSCYSCQHSLFRSLPTWSPLLLEPLPPPGGLVCLGTWLRPFSSFCFCSIFPWAFTLSFLDGCLHAYFGIVFLFKQFLSLSPGFGTFSSWPVGCFPLDAWASPPTSDSFPAWSLVLIIYSWFRLSSTQLLFCFNIQRFTPFTLGS